MSRPSVQNPQDVDRAAEKVTQAIRRGEDHARRGRNDDELPRDALRVIERGKFEKRIKNLEQEAAARGEHK